MRFSPVRAAVCALLAATSLASHAASAVVETPTIPASGDADDPAVWLNPVDASKSLVITAVKNEGLRVYDLAGRQLQSLLPPGRVDGVASRLNNVDVQYGLRLADGSRADVAVFTDRGQDTLRTFRINAAGATPLTEITNYGRLFPDQPVSEQATGYGLALWRDQRSDRLYSLVAQRHGSQVAQFEMVAQTDGTVRSQQVRAWTLPSTYKGRDLNQDDFSPQSEGMVVDQQTGMLYVGQEDVGIWGIDLKTGTLGGAPLVETTTFDPSSPISADVEGLTLRYGSGGEGVIIASSQGDDSFAAFDRNGFGHLGSFRIGASAGGIDAVQESDGADVTSFALPGFESGVFITQDGYDGDDFDADATNFKYLKWGDLAADNAFLAPYAELPAGFDPRTVGAVPEPTSLALMLAGLIAVLFVGRRTRRQRDD